MAAALAAPGSNSRAAEPTRICIKAVPEITFENLSPPYTDYRYFESHHSFPFEYNATGFSPVNAWWLAEASTLVYAEVAFVRRQFKKAGLTKVKFFNRSGTQCFVATNSRYAIVAFRGSEIWKRGERFDPRRIMNDLKTDIDIRLSDWENGGKVHKGFKDALDQVWGDLSKHIEELRAQGLKIWLTGHSLGGALATLAADRLTVQGLYTFGAPRVGDQEFSARFDSRAFRVVNGRDIVARVPPKAFFRHVGELKRIDAMNIPSSLSGHRNRIHANPQCPKTENVAQSSHTDFHIGTADFIPRPICDHVPLLYAISIWNELVETFDRGDPMDDAE